MSARASTNAGDTPGETADLEALIELAHVYVPVFVTEPPRYAYQQTASGPGFRGKQRGRERGARMADHHLTRLPSGVDVHQRHVAAEQRQRKLQPHLRVRWQRSVNAQLEIPLGIVGPRRRELELEGVFGVHTPHRGTGSRCGDDVEVPPGHVVVLPDVRAVVVEVQDVGPGSHRVLGFVDEW